MLTHGGVHVQEEHAELLEVFAQGVVDDFGFVLGADAGQELALCLRDAKSSRTCS